MCDFGVAAHLITHSKRSTFVGTPYWMAPEVITDGKLYDTKADIWSLGISIYEMAVGNPPLAHLEALKAIAHIPRDPPPRLDTPTASQGLKDFVALCLNEEPNDRLSAEELQKNRWLKTVAKANLTILRELIGKYKSWVDSGGVRQSIATNADNDRPESMFEGPDNWNFDVSPIH